MKVLGLKRGVVAFAVACMLLLALPGTAMASGVTQGNDIINKTWTAASNQQLNDSEEFTFEVTYNRVESMNGNETATPTINGTDVTSYEVVLKDVTWQSNANSSNSATASLKASDIFKDVDFSKPGDYYFTIQEQQGENPNITYDTTTHTIKVEVSWTDNYPSSDATLVQSVWIYDNGSKNTSGAAVNNTAAPNSTLTISKTVSGAAAYTEDVFTYTLSLTSGTKGSYTVTLADGTEATVSADQPLTFYLSHGQSIVVANLPVDAEYTVTETDVKGYTANYSFDKETYEPGAAVSGGIDADGVEVAYKNTKGFAPDSGITANMLPFVGLFALALVGGIALIVARMRRSSEVF